MSTLCMHHNDVDGRASAAIIRRALGSQVLLYEMNYGDPLPQELVDQADRVIVVDFSLPKEEMQRLEEGRHFTWIDHHISAIIEMRDEARAWEGIRDTSDAACVLTWRYYFPNRPVPRAIILIGDRDAWHWAEEETGAFDEGLNQQNTDPHNDDLWKPLLEDEPDLLNQLVSQGSLLREAHLYNIRRQVDNYGYPVEFEGYHTLVINTRGNGDIGTYVRELGYQVAYCYVDNLQNGTLTTFVGLYSREIDVSRIALKFGGGGHRGASGFSFERSCTPFPLDARVKF